MKKNAILIAGILCVASASRAQDNASDRYKSGQYDASSGEASAAVYGDDISADSSRRGGSLDARGYDQEANNDEIESAPKPINPGNQADSSIRGGSLEARGAREATRDRSQTDTTSHYHPNPIWDHSSQGGSITVENDVGLSSSPNWNPGDDQLRDGVDVEGQSTSHYERNNDASVGGAAKAESGKATFEDVELDYQHSPTAQQSESSALKDDLNSSVELEKNISGEFDTHSDLRSDIERENREAVGAAATSESGSSSSSNSYDYNSSFESKDPALKSTDTPLKESDIDFLYQDNRAHGVGSLATGEFSAAVAAQSSTRLGSDERLSQDIKSRLTRESAGANATMKSDVVRNVQVSANNGEVTLTGTVPSEKDKQIIEIRAAEMPGVRVVKNELTVAPEADAGIRDLERSRNLEDRTSDQD